MKILKRISAILLSAGLTGALMTTALAAQPYTYTVRMFSGAQGTFTAEASSDPEVKVIDNVQYSTEDNRIVFNTGDIKLSDDSKYYVKGIRESGKDNNTVSVPSQTVKRDIDYVVAYGLLNDPVEYTINYVDSNGNKLLDSETFYGNVGDYMVVAYRYVDGYRPQAYNLQKKELSANKEENVFTFRYTKVTTAQQTTTNPSSNNGSTAGTTVRPNQNTTTTVRPNIGNTANNNANNNANNQNNGNTANTPNTANNGNNTNAEENTADNPAELQDIDDGSTPLAGVQNNSDDTTVNPAYTNTPKSYTAIKIAMGIGAVVILGAAGFGVWWYLKKKKAA